MAAVGRRFANSGDPVGFPVEQDRIVYLGPNAAKRGLGELDREIVFLAKPADLEGFRGFDGRDDGVVGPPAPSHWLPNFIQDLRQIGGFFVFDAHPRGGMSIQESRGVSPRFCRNNLSKRDGLSTVIVLPLP